LSVSSERESGSVVEVVKWPPLPVAHWVLNCDKCRRSEAFKLWSYVLKTEGDIEQADAAVPIVKPPRLRKSYQLGHTRTVAKGARSQPLLTSYCRQWALASLGDKPARGDRERLGSMRDRPGGRRGSAERRATRKASGRVRRLGMRSAPRSGRLSATRLHLTGD
jgi:hypothetical protein